MWCANCNQEVPAIAAKSNALGVDGGYVVCARCGVQLSAQGLASKNLRVDTAHTTSSQSNASNPVAKDPNNIAQETSIVRDIDDPGVLSSFDSDLGLDKLMDTEFWDEHELMQAKIAVNSYRMVELNENSIVQRTPIGRSELNSGGIRREDTPNQPRNGPSTQKRAPQRPSLWRVLSWATICAGMMLFAFGGALTIWSVVTGRRELFELGVPPCLVGQGILMLGLMFQLERLWRVHRQTLRNLIQLQKATGQLSRESVVRDQINSVN